MTENENKNSEKMLQDKSVAKTNSRRTTTTRRRKSSETDNKNSKERNYRKVEKNQKIEAEEIKNIEEKATTKRATPRRNYNNKQIVNLNSKNQI